MKLEKKRKVTSNVTKYIFRSTVFIVTLWSCTTWGVQEIADPNLQDIAMVTVLRGQPVIIYNPYLCQQAGPDLCGFYRTHEYCHINLGHTIRQMWPQQKELEADCCAAKRASVREVGAAYQWFSAGGGSSPMHGWGWQRAARISYCRN